MKRTRVITIVAVIIALVMLSLNMAVHPVAAQSGRIITSAKFSIFVTSFPSGQTVNLHRIIVPWVEGTGQIGGNGSNGVTWNSFAGGFDPAVITSFTITQTGWYTVDVTSLVQGWVAHTFPNYGFLLQEPGTTFTEYHSSEYTIDPTLRPVLAIDYTTAGVPGHVTIQRGLAQGGVADTFIESLAGQSDNNFGNSDHLVTGHTAVDNEKQTLIRFELTSPTAVTLQSLDARASSAPDLTLPAIGVLGMLGVVVLRLRRTSNRPPSQTAR